MYEQNSKVTFGICADPHKDIMHDANERLRVFVDEMNRRKVDFIIHLGDFAHPARENQDFLDIWESFCGAKYHTVGNHDPEKGFTYEDLRKYWKLEYPYYSFDCNGFHFVVLDGNDASENHNPSCPDFPAYIGSEQLAWLKDDLLSSEYPSFIFSHQTLEDERGVDNWQQIRALFDNINAQKNKGRIVACFCGDLHLDAVNKVNGIYYIYVNSMSNHWMGEEYAYIRYSDEIDKQYPAIKYTAPYKDSLYATITITNDKIKIKGKKSEFVGPSPRELGYPVDEKRGKIEPIITSQELQI